MFDIGATEMLLVAIVALLVIGPKDLPLALRTAGRWMGKLRGMTKHFRAGIDSMIREAEIEEQEKLWAERNAKIMREHPPENLVQGGQGEAPEEAEDAAPADGAPVGKPAPPTAPSKRAPPPPASDADRRE